MYFVICLLNVWNGDSLYTVDLHVGYYIFLLFYTGKFIIVFRRNSKKAKSTWVKLWLTDIIFYWKGEGMVVVIDFKLIKWKKCSFMYIIFSNTCRFLSNSIFSSLILTFFALRYWHIKCSLAWHVLLKLLCDFHEFDFR